MYLSCKCFRCLNNQYGTAAKSNSNFKLKWDDGTAANNMAPYKLRKIQSQRSKNDKMWWHAWPSSSKKELKLTQLCETRLWKLFRTMRWKSQGGHIMWKHDCCCNIAVKLAKFVTKCYFSWQKCSTLCNKVKQMMREKFDSSLETPCSFKHKCDDTEVQIWMLG